MTNDTAGKKRKTLLTSARFYADNVLNHPKNPDIAALDAEIETTQKEGREAAEREQLLPKPTEADKQQREEFREYLQEVTYKARSINWNIFQPDWTILKTAPCFPINLLVGLSVGIHHHFSIPNWIVYRAIPYFEGEEWARFPCAPNMPSIETKTDPTQANEENLKLLCEFMTRRKTTINHLQPRGDLMPVAGAHEFAEIQPSNFIRFADLMNWDIPAEFKQTLNSIRTINKQQPKAEPETKNPTNEKSNNMLKLIFVMAVDGYEYNPNDTRNAATGDKFGINQKISRHINRRLDDATIKNCLDTAEALLGLFNKKTHKPRAKTILSLFIGMMMDRYENNHAKQSDMSKKLLEAITRVNDKLSLTIDIDSDAIEEILTEAKKA